MTVYVCADGCGWSWDTENIGPDDFQPASLQVLPDDAVAPFTRSQLVTRLLCPVCQYRRLSAVFMGGVPAASIQSG